jgi:hypothetical protein
MIVTGGMSLYLSNAHASNRSPVGSRALRAGASSSGWLMAMGGKIQGVIARLMFGDLACSAGLTAEKNKPPAGGLSVFAIWPLSGAAA